MLLGLIERPLLIKNDADLIMYQGIRVPTYSLCLREAQECSSQIVCSEIFHSNKQGSQMTSREESSSSSIGSHGLVRLVLRCEGMTKSNPACSKVFVKSICLIEIFPSQVILLNQEVVGADCEPGDCQIWVCRHEFVS